MRNFGDTPSPPRIDTSRTVIDVGNGAPLKGDALVREHYTS